MKKIRTLATTALLIGVVIFGCKKDQVEPNPGAPNPGNPNPTTDLISDLFANTGEPLQAFTMDASTWNVITAAKGTRFYFQPNSFVDNLGNVVSGQVDIEIKEVFSKSDMILSNKFPIGEYGLLESGGQLFINVKQNGAKLQFGSGNSASVDLPVTGTAPQWGMGLFIGNTADPEADNLTWAADPDSGWATICVDSSNQDSSYCFNLDTMDWINLDVYMNDPNQTSATVVVPGGYDDENTRVFVVFNNENAAASLTTYSNGAFVTGSGYAIGIGRSVTFVAIAIKNGEYQSAFAPTTIVANHEEILQFSTTTKEDFETALNAL